MLQTVSEPLRQSRERLTRPVPHATSTQRRLGHTGSGSGRDRTQNWEDGRFIRATSTALGGCRSPAFDPKEAAPMGRRPEAVDYAAA